MAWRASCVDAANDELPKPLLLRARAAFIVEAGGQFFFFEEKFRRDTVGVRFREPIKNETFFFQSVKFCHVVT